MVGRQGPGGQGWLRLPICKPVTRVGSPRSCLADRLRGSVSAGGRQPPVQLITAAGEMDGHRVNIWSGSPGPVQAWEGAGPGSSPSPWLPCVFSGAQPRLLCSRSRTVEGSRPCESAGSSRYWLCGLGQNTYSFWAQGHVCEQWHQRIPCGGAHEQPLR